VLEVNFMAGGLIVSGAAGYLAAWTGFYQQIAGTPLIWVVMLAPLAAIFFLSLRIERMSLTVAQATFWIYAVLQPTWTALRWQKPKRPGRSAGSKASVLANRIPKPASHSNNAPA
jgi:hypothetical protein